MRGTRNAKLTYFGLKLFELLVLRFPVCLDLLLGLISCLLYALCAVCFGQVSFLLEFVCACVELYSHSLATVKSALRNKFILHPHAKDTSLNDLLSFPLSLYSISFAPFDSHHSLLRRMPTSSRVWIPAEFCADFEQISPKGRIKLEKIHTILRVPSFLGNLRGVVGAVIAGGADREVEGSFAPKAKLRDPCSATLVHFFHRNFHSCSQLQILRYVALKFNCMV